MNLIIEATGWLGCFLILLAYFFLSQKKWLANSKPYLFSNIAGAIFVLINALAHQAWPIVILEALWAIVGFRGLAKIRKSYAR